ncbi:hypothetical protein CPB86DRAFT_787027 [Serendipita vermifera]|nr:hypothetical protein CPB86DRAFT_787027 [Serendipita vermifera]
MSVRLVVKTLVTDSSAQSGESMISRYEDLIAACKMYDRTREEASSIKAVKELKQWHEAGPNGASSKLLLQISNKDFSLFVLPEVGRSCY